MKFRRRELGPGSLPATRSTWRAGRLSTVGELAFATLCVFAIEEVVDSLLLIVMAKHGVNALRVKPAFNLRSALFLGCVIATVFGFLQIAERVTWEGEEERAVFAGNSTAAPT